MIGFLRERRLIDQAQAEVAEDYLNELVALLKYNKDIENHIDDMPRNVKQRLSTKYKNRNEQGG